MRDFADPLEEVGAYCQKVRERMLAINGQFESILAAPAPAERIRTDEAFRAQFLSLLGVNWLFPHTQQLISFMSSVLEEIWQEAQQPLSFSFYDEYRLMLLIDILRRVDLTKASPDLLKYLADALDRVGSYIDPEGDAVQPSPQRRRGRIGEGEIPEGLLRELRSFTGPAQREGLRRVTSRI